MTSWILLPVALVLLCSSSLCSLGCDLTQGLQEDFSLLNQMSTFPLVPCWKDRTSFNFPKEEMEKGSQLQRRDATVIVHEMLQQIFTIFSLKAVPAAWNQTQLMQLFIGLDQQLQQLEKCLGQGGEWEEPFLENENFRLALKRYFQGISQYLQGKDYSHCSWEIVRVEIRRVFLSMSKLTRKLRD
ncbi:interferon alpha-1-like [Macrotis lagotis]|uniref:interferon alpha-1-like n=1 Tax=Macrotis lagotis TaxID=92651 RepID=UPI003D683510